MQYIVKSGDGHFVKFENNTPEMTSDPVSAYRMDLEQARNVVKLLDQLGFDGELVEVTVGKIKVKEKSL